MATKSELTQVIEKNKNRIVKVGQTWKHYKGGLYKIIAISRFESDPTKYVVTYEPMYETDENIPWSCFLNVFLDPVKLVGFDSEGKPKVINRFELVEDA